MRFQPSRAKLVSIAASLIGVALVVKAALFTGGSQPGHVLMCAGTGLYLCVWAFVPVDEFLRVARLPVQLSESPERKAYVSLFPRALLPVVMLSAGLSTVGFVMVLVHAFQ